MLTNLITFLNQLANNTLGVLFQTIGWMPGVVSIGVIGAITGVLMLVTFKYTSNQSAIKHTRDQIKANLLGLSLFKDNLGVALGMQARLLLGAASLLMLSIVPMLVMIVPTCLILSQLALWYQARPLEKGEQAIVTLHASENTTELEQVQLVDSPSFEVTKGPVHVASKQMICWEIKAAQDGQHEMQFTLGQDCLTKELSVGSGFMAVSEMRPGTVWMDTLLHPREVPFPADSPVQSITIDYPERSSWTYGSHTWLITWFLVSMIAAFASKPLLQVNI